MKKTNIFLTGLATSCALYISQIVLTHKYDWDIDQFMYFGSRLANGELAFTREYDDKSIAVHALFIIPFWLKSIRTWYIISTLAVAATGLLLYRKLLENKRQAKEQAAISTMYFIFLLISTRGGINHINGIAACMTLACVCGIALTKNRKTKPKEAISISLYMLFGAWSISIRPYYIMSILTTIAWPSLKAALTNGNLLSEDRKNILDKNTILISLGRVSLLVVFAAAINILPYLITGEGKALGDAFQINKVSITPGIQEGIAGIFLVAIQKAPLISAPLIASNVLLIIETIKGIGAKGLNAKNYLYRKMDIIYAGTVMPITLAIMISTRHFHDHYLVLFAPFSTITLYYLLSEIKRDRASKFQYQHGHKKAILKRASEITVGLGVTYHCIYPIVKINEQFQPWSMARTEGREKILKELETLTRTDSTNSSFVVTRDNHFHWRLDQSRMGIPHASLLSKIATNHGNIFEATTKANKLNTKFSYPTTKQLCNTMMGAKPDIYLVPKDSLEEDCLKQRNSNYNFYKEVERGHKWNLTNTKTGVIYKRAQGKKTSHHVVLD